MGDQNIHAIYKRQSLGELIDILEDIGQESVQGLTGTVDSYRGFYERTSTPPTGDISTGAALAASYLDRLGSTMHGWKGGEYTVDPDEPVHYAEPRDTGPAILGLNQGADGIWRPVVLAQDDWL
jgi:hypothetical protein